MIRRRRPLLRAAMGRHKPPDDPLTGRPYGMRFPLITIGDIVNAQRKLVTKF